MKFFRRCTRATVLAVCAGTVAFQTTLAGTVTFKNPCDCDEDGVPCHGTYRWAVKTERIKLPASIPKNNHVSPSEICRWAGPDITFSNYTARVGTETNWYEVRGVVTALRAEADGDLHIELKDSNGIYPGQLVVKIPAGSVWCKWRREALSWSKRQPTVPTDLTLALTNRPLIKVTGRAFYDGAHCDGNFHSNDRSGPGEEQVTVWEIHPVMKLEIMK